MTTCSATEDFFRARLDHMIDLRNPLVILASRLPWQQLEAVVSHLFARKSRSDQAVPDLDLFGECPTPRGRQSHAGRPRVPLRTMISLLYLKHAFNESDERVVERWSETPRWQYFSGQAYFEERLPCDATTLVKFRALLGEEGVEELLAQTINVALELKLISRGELTQVIVDSTVQPKAIAHPTDSKLLEIARIKLVETAKNVGIDLKQTYAKEGKTLGYQASRYAHARQFKRMKRTIKRQRTIVGRLHRELARKTSTLSAAIHEIVNPAIAKSKQIIVQSAQRKSGEPKLYAWHAPEVACINKGKSRQPYEFGCKVGIAVTLKHNLIVGARAFHGNPYDGHTLQQQIEQSTILMQDNSIIPNTAYVDLGYRGVDRDNPGLAIKHRGKFKTLSEAERKNLKRRQAIEPIIGHLKQDHRMDRCHLKGETGDRIHAVLCAAGFNIKWLLRMILKKGVKPFLCLLSGTHIDQIQKALRDWLRQTIPHNQTLTLRIV